MQKSRLIIALNSLSKPEQKAFRSFVSSIYFNSNKKMLDVLDYIFKCQQAGKEEKLDSKKMASHFFSNNQHKAQRLRESFSDLFALLKKFLILQELDSDADTQNLMLLKQLRKRELNKLYQSQHKKLFSHLTENSSQDESFFENQYLLLEEEEVFFAQNDFRKNEDSLQRLILNLDIFYINKKNAIPL